VRFQGVMALGIIREDGVEHRRQSTRGLLSLDGNSDRQTDAAAEFKTCICEAGQFCENRNPNFYEGFIDLNAQSATGTT
jgi:hypothetical protein